MVFGTQKRLVKTDLNLNIEFPISEGQYYMLIHLLRCQS